MLAAISLAIACSQREISIIRHTPIKGLSGYDVTLRHAEDVPRYIRDAKPPLLIRTYEVTAYQKQQLKLSALPQPSPLRRERIQLRRNRNEILLARKKADN